MAAIAPVTVWVVADGDGLPRLNLSKIADGGPRPTLAPGLEAAGWTVERARLLPRKTEGGGGGRHG